VVATGGSPTPSDALVGPVTVAALSELNVDLRFPGVHGFAPRTGCTSPDMVEAATDRALVAAADGRPRIAPAHRLAAILGKVISVALARRLQDAGLAWHPAPGDRFVIPQPALDGTVFTLSDMTIEVHEYPSGTILGFNGTTEWALDSVEKGRTIWLPREDQLRDLLGGTFRSLARDGSGWVVRVAIPGHPAEEFVAQDPAEAYGEAVLALVSRATGAP
jgi:hypothetical protein